MTQPPIVPSQPPHTAGMPPTTHPAGPAGPTRAPSTSRALAFWTSGPGIAVIFAILGVLLVGWLLLAPGGSRQGDAFDVDVVGCEFTAPGAAVQTAKVGITVRNTGTSTRDATVQVEYRDAAGTRVDTDTVRIRRIAAGDTARAEESTVLDAPITGQGSCQITGVS